jgi:hypothetical protein
LIPQAHFRVPKTRYSVPLWRGKPLLQEQGLSPAGSPRRYVSDTSSN